jgi:hypothetical protein
VVVIGKRRIMELNIFKIGFKMNTEKFLKLLSMPGYCVMGFSLSINMLARAQNPELGLWQPALPH